MNTAASTFLVIGERTNITGSPKFAKLILDGRYEEALSVDWPENLRLPWWRRLDMYDQVVIGLGLAAPYVVLSWHPAWLKFLPKPGAWMEQFKIAMGFPMLATALWLFDLADNQPAGHWDNPAFVRPVDLAVIDGVESIAGGEGPWNWGVRAVEPKLLLAGRNPVCTDAVGAAVMGYDPAAKHGESHFPGENHLRWLAEAGVGTNDPARIEVCGLDIKTARFPFRPA